MIKFSIFFLYVALFQKVLALDIHNVCTINSCKNNAKCIVNPKNSKAYLCECPRGFAGEYCSEQISTSCATINPCQNRARCSQFGAQIKCHCTHGWYGDYCEKNYDDCKHNPCRNGGNCHDLANHKYRCDCPPSFTGMNCEYRDYCVLNYCGVNSKCVSDISGVIKCICDKGFTGDTCSVDIDECSVSDTPLCENNARCINTHGSYKCECTTGYTGDRCEIDIRECKNSTCLNGGTCLDKIGRYECHCTEHFKGKNCEIPIPSCDRNPCRNSGQCHQITTAEFYCVCPEDWHGRFCEKRVNPCSGNPCGNNGICQETSVDGYQCICAPGYTGIRCTEDIDECAFKPCLHGGRCIDKINAYQCECPTGLTGKQCEINVDDCVHAKCMNGGICDDRVNGITCRCPVGFVGLRCEVPNDICAQLEPCSKQLGAQCINDPTVRGGYRCVCPDNQYNGLCQSTAVQLYTKCERLQCLNNGYCFVENGIEKCRCIDGFSGGKCQNKLIKCSHNPCKHGATCYDLEDRYFCECQPGYKGQNCEMNIDECAGNPCGVNGRCIDMVNGYRCQCYGPYRGSRCTLKMDPCQEHKCLNYALCIPRHDYLSYTCNCNMSFGRFTGNHCEIDVNECSLSHQELIEANLLPKTSGRASPCYNQGNCTNTEGSFVCKCPPGFTGTQCELNINDCLPNPCMNGATCLDLVSDYKCECSRGFYGHNCQISHDLCVELQQPCKNQGKCLPHVNDYQCLCPKGWSGRNCEVNDNDCSPSSCSGHGQCIDKVNSFICKCQDGYSGENCELQNKPCDSKPCGNNGSCVNKVTDQNKPGYMCNCAMGFTGPRCEIQLDWCLHNPCGINGKCIISEDLASFKCVCNKYYMGERCETIIVDSCRSYALKKFGNSSATNQICHNLGQCVDRIVDPEVKINSTSLVNIHSGFECSCRLGYTGSLCEVEINECADQPCLNGGTCRDGIGMYYCDCPSGFQGFNCQHNRNECQPNPCQHGQCIDLVDGYQCLCPLGASGKNCEIIKDFCLEKKCQNEGRCINELSGAKCKCLQGYSGENCEVNINECRYKMNGALLEVRGVSNGQYLGPCSPIGTLECIDGIKEAQCRCKARYSGKYCEQHIADSCESERIKGKHTCLNGGLCLSHVSGNYTCQCPEGYSGDKCELFSAQCLIEPRGKCLYGGICRPSNSTGNNWRCECPRGLGGLRCENDFINECQNTGGKPFTCYNGGQCKDGAGSASCVCKAGFCGKHCEIESINCVNYIHINKDKSNTQLSSQLQTIYKAEIDSCADNNCKLKAGNKRCDIECNNLACGFDGGECLHRVPQVVEGAGVKLAIPWQNCTIIHTQNIPCHHLFDNGKCDKQCNTEQCLFDGWDCQPKFPKCPRAEYCLRKFEDGHCDEDCNNEQCNYDGGDCVIDQNRERVNGSIILILRVPVNEFLAQWEQKLLVSLTELLHSFVKIKRYNDGAKMIFPIRVLAQKHDLTSSIQQQAEKQLDQKALSRHKRSVQQGQPGTKVYLELENSMCKKNQKNQCFDSTKSAADFVSASMYRKSYSPPVPILSVQSDTGLGPIGPPHSNKIRDVLVYVILVMTCIVVVGILMGVLYGLSQNKQHQQHHNHHLHHTETKKRTLKAEIWYPDSMKRNRSNSSSTNILKRNTMKLLQNSNNNMGLNVANKRNLPGGITLNDVNSSSNNAITTSNTTTNSSSLDDNSGSNSLTSTRITSYYDPVCGNNNNNNNNQVANAFYDDCNNNMTGSNLDLCNSNGITCSSSFDNNNNPENIRLLNNNAHGAVPFPMKFHRNDLSSNQQQTFERCCFNAVHKLLISGSGLGELSLNESHENQIELKNLLKTAAAAAINSMQVPLPPPHQSNNNNSNNTNNATTNLALLNHHHNQQQFPQQPNNITPLQQQYPHSAYHWFNGFIDRKKMSEMFPNTVLISLMNMTEPQSQQTLIHIAAKYNRREAVTILLEAGSNPNALDASGRSSFMLAVDAGAYETVAYLLEQQCVPIDVHMKGPGGTTCLMQAVKLAHTDIIKLLLHYMQPDECDLNITDDLGRTALHWAAATDQAWLVYLLLTFGLNRDAQDHEEMSALYLACKEGAIDVVKVLLDNGANIDMSDHLDRLAIDVARESNFTDIVQLIEAHVLLAKDHHHHHHNQSHIRSAWAAAPNHYVITSNSNYNNIPNQHNKINPLLYKMDMNFPAQSTGLSNYSTTYNTQQQQQQQQQPQQLSQHNLGQQHNNYSYQYPYNNNSQQLISCSNNNNHNNSSSSGGGDIPQTLNITPSPDSESPGHWSTSSPSLSPHSRAQQQQHQQQNHKPSVLHYLPSTTTTPTTSTTQHYPNTLQQQQIHPIHHVHHLDHKLLLNNNNLYPQHHTTS